MRQPNYWLDLFTARTWEEFNVAGASVSGFREKRCKTVQQVKPGDYVLCYLTGISRFIGALTVTSEAYKDKTPIWEQDPFPCRVKVKPILQLTPETGVPILDLKARLSSFKNTDASAAAWTGFVRGSPSKWKQTDGEVVMAALQEAARNPVARPYNPAKLAYKPKALDSAIGSVVIPETEPEPQQAAPKEISAHTEIQSLLAKLGNDIGLDVWVARNDRNKDVGGKRFTELTGLKSDLPLQFDDATNKTMESIDILWMQKHSIVAAFEIESTTSVSRFTVDFTQSVRHAPVRSCSPTVSGIAG